MTQARNASKAQTGALHSAPLLKTTVGTLFILFTLLLAACGSSTAVTSTGTTNTTNGAGTSLTPTGPEVTLTVVPDTAVSTNTSSAYAVKVYFSKFPDSLNNFKAVFPVNRTSPSSAVATYSLQLLIAGPTLSERSAGYFSEFNSILTGPSSCSAPHPTGGPDFTLSLNKKGSKVSPGTATVRFCRASQSPGIGADARIMAEITATLKQFSTIKNVVVLTKAGQCFGDESGLNVCLK
ncbi:MAG TPA: hypothetical protein VFN23_09810 [Ktedonobacteraceae bacterium]|nr:hypothetical protein [Ktedonobacteraceae bacterium]